LPVLRADSIDVGEGLDPGTLAPDLIRPGVLSLRQLQPGRERVGIRAAGSRYVRFDRRHPSAPKSDVGACTVKDRLTPRSNLLLSDVLGTPKASETNDQGQIGSGGFQKASTGCDSVCSTAEIASENCLFRRLL
jgi:hypothetical protein